MAHRLETPTWLSHVFNITIDHQTTNLQQQKAVSSHSQGGEGVIVFLAYITAGDLPCTNSALLDL